MEEEKKNEKVTKLLDNMAEAGARMFESFLQEHQDATMEEKHKKLKEIFETSIMTGLLIVPMAL